MQYRKLGNTDIEGSRIAFGCWAIIGGFNWGPEDEKDSRDALRAAYEAGVTFFDSAEGYGNGRSEQLLGEALGSVRDKILIATKVGPRNFEPDKLRSACEQSLRNLQTDRIDLYQLHWPKWEIPVSETLGVLDELKQEGKIRAYGVSNFGPVDLGDCTSGPYTICSNQVAYNLLFRAVEYEIQLLCVHNDFSVLPYSPIMQGLLSGKFLTVDDMPAERVRTRHFASSRPNCRHDESGQEEETFAAVARVRRIAEELGEPMADVSLAWLLAQPGVASVIVGGRNAEQARRNVRAAELTLPDEAIAQLSEATECLKEKLGPSGDMWQTPPRMR